MSLLLALDQGTTSSRAILFELDGTVRAVAQREFAQHFPRPGWVEHDPEEIWRTQHAVMDEAMARAGAGARDVAAIGITNQRETTVVWERSTGRPIHNAIVWQDRRTADACEALQDKASELVRERTGLEVDAYFSGTKVAWILDNVPGARRRAERGELAFGTIDAWLLWNLTGGAVHATDVSNASRTMLLDIRSGTWDSELLALLQVPHAVLPEVRPSCGAFGAVAAGPASGVPVAGIAGDQQAALFGQACHEPGLAKSTYGTGCFMLLNVGDAPMPSRHRLLTTIAWQAGARTTYALEGSVFIGGAAVQWLRDGLGVIDSAADIEPLAASVPDSGGAYFVPAFAGLGAPHWDQRARGAILGLTRGTTRGHLARAALEGIAHQVADVLEAMQRDVRDHDRAGLTELRVDGGAARNDLLMQMQADLLGCPLVRPAVTETTALGAAYLAGLAVGTYADEAAIARQWRVDRTFEPAAAADAVAARRAGWHRAIERARDWETT